MSVLEDGFLTQGELLKYLGKNENDRKLISRMAERGEVYREGGRYYIRERKGKEEYLDEIRRLREENYKLKEELFKKEVVGEKETSGNDGDLEFQIKENEKLEKQILVYQNAIKESYYYVNSISKAKITRPDYKEKIKLRLDVSGEYDQ